MVQRDRAVRLAEHVLRSAHDGQQDWPLSLVTEVYLFGSFARGALAPHDLDIDVEHENDEVVLAFRHFACLRPRS